MLFLVFFHWELLILAFGLELKLFLVVFYRPHWFPKFSPRNQWFLVFFLEYNAFLGFFFWLSKVFGYFLFAFLKEIQAFSLWISKSLRAHMKKIEEEQNPLKVVLLSGFWSKKQPKSKKVGGAVVG